MKLISRNTSATLPQKVAFLVLAALLVTPLLARAQFTQQPEREQMLNGLRLLLVHKPGDGDVFLSLRIHSGAAFDVEGKAGEMAVLGDILFPDPTTREYFTDEMAGRLDVDTDHDSITINMKGRADQFERIVEILRTALVTTQITPENVARIRDGRIKIAKETVIAPDVLADRAIAARLFGDFPYGRPASGSAESLSRVDRADLLLARERFLNANNATLVIMGGVQRSRAVRALRQLLGPWRKSEQIIPTTFRQPTAPDVRPLVINAASDQSAEIRLAARGLARSDRDFNTVNLLAIVARGRWQKLSPENARRPLFVRHEAHVLPGMFVMGAAVDTLLVAKTLTQAREAIQSLILVPATVDELARAKAELNAQVAKDLTLPEGIARAWLDADTFGLSTSAVEPLQIDAITPADLQRVANRLFKDAPVATIIIGDSKQLKAALEPSIKVEMMGEIAPRPAKSETKPAMTIPIRKPE
ncbi:MAG TPA: insulinase family protein [Pyrinomonadaceae bacterium]|nr:insulinase family protein [Pyrinomonadaceae bacterium]